MTGCERILARLEQGPATAAELYATTYTVVHSRIADLRKRGHVITCEHVEGKGAQSYLYWLQPSMRGGSSSPHPTAVGALLIGAGTDGSESLPSGSAPAQMSFSKAA